MGAIGGNRGIGGQAKQESLTGSRMNRHLTPNDHSVNIPIRNSDGSAYDVQALRILDGSVSVTIYDSKTRFPVFSHIFNSQYFAGYESQIEKDVLEASAVAGYLGWTSLKIIDNKFKSIKSKLKNTNALRSTPQSIPNSFSYPDRPTAEYKNVAYKKDSKPSFGDKSEILTALGDMTPDPEAEPAVARRSMPTVDQSGVPRITAGAKRRAPQNILGGGLPRIAAKPKMKHCPDVDIIEESMSFTHDYDCSGVVDGIGIGVCKIIQVNFKSCCQDHDIGLWCAPAGIPPEQWALKVSAELSGCIVGKFAEAAAKIPWYCFLVDIGLHLIAALVYAITYGLGTALESIYELIVLGPNEYFAFDGRNRKSCLCGGREPTSWSQNPCVNLCDRHGKDQECFKCHWRCVMENGKFARREWITDPSGKLGCCPGHTQACINDCDETDFSKCNLT